VVVIPCVPPALERADDVLPGSRLGVFGGTFDPIHIGHLIVAEEARVCQALDWVLFIPARISPLKQEEGTLFSSEERWQMVTLAIADNPRFVASRVDLDRQGPSYTVDTLRQLKAIHRPASLHFILGADSLRSLCDWRQPEEIAQLARLVAISRPGYDLGLEKLNRDIPGLAEVTDILETLQIGISSTDIRRRLRQGLPISYQVPRAVERFIYQCASHRGLVLANRCGPRCE
jgi:nicotinate-nucleotide adenylyltransferase